VNDYAAFARSVQFVESMQDQMATRRVPFAHGTALVHDRLPYAWDLNFVRLNPEDPVPAGDLIAEVDAVLGSLGLAHRKINADAEALGHRLDPDLRAMGWRATQSLVMVFRGGVAEPPGAHVVEVNADALSPKWEMGIRSAPWAADNEQTVVQLLEAQRLRQRAVTVRYFAARIDGQLVSECSLFLDGGVAQLESVHTLEAYRRRGLAAAVIRQAVNAAVEAGCGLVFLLADAQGGAKQLYRGLGFAEVGRVWDFVKAP
jgi:ribosomal protein S18 acetylase RimI-like enzyme